MSEKDELVRGQAVNENGGVRKRGRGRKRNGPRRGARLNADGDGVAGEERQMNCWEKRKEGGERARANDG